jgi:hypothetical protein
MITSWKVCGINDIWWFTTFPKTGSISHTIKQERQKIQEADNPTTLLATSKRSRIIN